METVRFLRQSQVQYTRLPMWISSTLHECTLHECKYLSKNRYKKHDELENI